jgi:hypothetical protein
MKRSHFLAVAISMLALGWGLVSVSAEEPTEERSFGVWDAIGFDGAVVQNVKVSGDDIFIMLQPDHKDDQLTMKISMQKGAPYRKWFTGDEVLVAQENSGRAANSWTDRIQISAKFIEYYAGGKLFLHLKRR